MKRVRPSQAKPADGQAPINQMGDTKSSTWSERMSSVESALVALCSLTKIGAIAALVVWLLFNQEFLERWLWGLSGGEFLGFKFERSDIDEVTAELQLYAASLKKSPQDNVDIDVNLALDAIVRAARVAPAIVNSRILWVDDKPAGNAAIESILGKLKIIVVDVNSTGAAISAMQVSPYDVIITNVWRPADPENRAQKLDICRVHYFDFPDPKLEATFTNAQEVTQYGNERARQLGLDRFNVEANLHGAAGFGLAETVLSLPGTNKTRPQIIFFAADNAKVARPMCGYRITNRADVLLNSVVSILEQRNAQSLAAKSWSAKDTSTAKR